MIAIDKNNIKLPSNFSLIDKKRADAHKENKLKRRYNSGDIYNTQDVKNRLKKLYNYKCAYCESSLLDNPKHIEHYRPKKSAKRNKCDASYSYYWLAFSWDNLLLACTSCNSSKGSCFDIIGTRQTDSMYSKFSLKQLQNKIARIDKLEKPLLINPEQVQQTFLNQNLTFNTSGEMLSNESRLKKTIEICNLNRDELLLKRAIIINDLINDIKELKLEFSNDAISYKKDLLKIIKQLLWKVKENREFSAFRVYLLKNISAIEKLAI